ncbi:MAG: VOC family protein [Candidatus Lambdaproteobacteria bacterium]|nr:VOC family protein [Candidatus Lambdaproteobacteria bacterium]
MSQANGISFSHLGIYVTDLERMRDFYTRHLGLMETDRGPLGQATLVFLSGQPDEHHQMALVTGRPGEVPFNTINQISFRLESLAQLRALHGRLAGEGVDKLVSVTHGNAWSIYFHDPEGNRIECFVDSPWHVRQPVREPMDIRQTDAQIMAQTETLCRGLPGFRPRAEWRAELQRALDGR